MGNLLLEQQRSAALGYPFGCLGVGLRQYQNELLAAVAGKKVPGPCCGPAEHLGYALEAVIAGNVAVVVVVLLEEVDIQQDH